MTARPKIIVRIPLEERYYTQLCAACPQADFPVCLTPEELHLQIGDAVALIGGGPLSDDLLAAAPILRWFQVPFAGVEWALTPELVARGITVTNFSGVHVPNIPEHILALMFTFARQLRFLGHQQDQHIWGYGPNRRGEPPSSFGDNLFEIEGQTLGILGLGDIGASLAQMKPTAYIYNIGRGELIAQDALIAALRTGTIAGAGLDVATPEPLPTDSPLWDMPNVFITGHTAGPTPKYWERGIALVIENVRRFLADEPLRNVVDPAAGY